MRQDSVTFKAKFVYSEGFDYKQFHTEKNKKTIAQIDKFLEFMNSEKGADFLRTQPEKDIFELRVYKKDDDTITPKLWHKVRLIDGYSKLDESAKLKKRL